MRVMGLLPLEFSDCLTDSPYFRDNLHAHEKELERTSQSIKGLTKDVKDLIFAAKNLSKAQKNFGQSLVNFKFDCIGNSQTDDEIIIAGALRNIGNLILQIEDERDRILERASENFIGPLDNFRKENIGEAKEGKKKFDKETVKFCQSLERYLTLSAKKNVNQLQEADASLEMERINFYKTSLQYIVTLQEVQERKKFEFVETEASESAKQPCICRRLVCVEGMMNSDKYKAVLQTHLLPTMRRDFPDGDGIFQQDLAPCHTSCKMRTFFEESGLEVLDWPGNSPDINPIENLWVIMKRRLQKEDCSTMTKLISAGIRAWYHDEELAKMCSNLVESMPNRVQMLVKAKGGHEVGKEFKSLMTDLQIRIQKTRDHFNETKDRATDLMKKNLEVRKTPSDPGSLCRMYARQGYLFLLEKKAFGTAWTKNFCQYQKDSKRFNMIPYSQSTGKFTTTDSAIVETCLKMERHAHLKNSHYFSPSSSFVHTTIDDLAP
ncbi:Rho GTPase-activating protein 26 [Nymphon striatum]|nr:Rho GTPase-activating protein 26 [Nymphon striatum]